MTIKLSRKTKRRPSVRGYLTLEKQGDCSVSCSNTFAARVSLQPLWVWYAQYWTLRMACAVSTVCANSTILIVQYDTMYNMYNEDSPHGMYNMFSVYNVYNTDTVQFVQCVSICGTTTPAGFGYRLLFGNHLSKWIAFEQSSVLTLLFSHML